MTFETEIHVKDMIRMNILEDVLAGRITLSLRLNSESAKDYARDIHADGSRVQVYGKFNISEDPSGTQLTIRPVMIENALKVTFVCADECAGKSARILNGSTKTLINEFDIDTRLSYMELIPVGKEKYTLRAVYAEKNDTPANETAPVNEAVTAAAAVEDTPYAPPEPEDAELRRLELEIARVEQQQAKLRERRVAAAEKLGALEAEYKKDYGAFEEELAELKARTDADESVIEYYRDNDVKPVEELLDEVKAKLDEAEKQIRVFIEAKQRKTMEIENEVKANKR